MKVFRPSIKVTPYLSKLIESSEAVRKQFVPTTEELEEGDDSADPLGEDIDLVLPKCIHKYKNRILVLTPNICFANCRFCTRRRIIKKRESIITETEVDKIEEYLIEHQEIRDIIISGGDPLILTNTQLKYILSKFRKHVEILRIGTRTPIIQPKRITNRLVNMLAKFSPLYMNLNINHPDELTSEVKEKCDLLVEGGIILGSQTVLLKGINDDRNIMKELMEKLLTFRIRPYYLYLCDHVAGTKHFQTELKIGKDIIRFLRKSTSGLAIPRFVEDTQNYKKYLA